MADPSCIRLRALLEEKEGSQKEYLANKRDRQHLMAGLVVELTREVTGKQLSALTKARKSRTMITEIKAGGSTVSDARGILTAASAYFKEIFGKDRRLDFSDWKPVKDRQLRLWDTEGLDADWTEGEVQAAFASMAKNKSPGSDGMPKEFFEVNWDLLGQSFMALVKDFSLTAKLPDAVKGAVTILLHKKGYRY
ncbi:unnamed protein product [Closterium sp. NIES-54]